LWHEVERRCLGRRRQKSFRAVQTVPTAVLLGTHYLKFSEERWGTSGIQYPPAAWTVRAAILNSHANARKIRSGARSSLLAAVAADQFPLWYDLDLRGLRGPEQPCSKSSPKTLETTKPIPTSITPGAVFGSGGT
jgi:hypothetical protein